MSIPVRYDGLNERQLAFVKAVGLGMDTALAAREAGYACPDQESWRLLRLPAVLAAVHMEVRRRIHADAPVNLTLLQDLRRDPATPARVRADIGLQLMKLAGHIVPSTRQDLPDKQLSDMTREEMLAYIDRNQAEIDKAESELAARAKDISAQVPTQMDPLDEAKPLTFLD